MPFPTTSVIEQFTGANGTSPFNANWTNILNTPDIQDNQARGEAGADWGIAYWDTDTFGPDSEGYVTITAKDSGVEAVNGTIGVFVRAKDVGDIETVDGYWVYCEFRSGTDAIIAERLDNGVGTNLITVNQEISVNDAIGIEVIGSTNNVKIYRKPSGGSWGQIGSTASDNTYQLAGYIVLGINGGEFNGDRADDLGGGTVVAGETARVSGTKKILTPNSTWFNRELMEV